MKAIVIGALLACAVVLPAQAAGDAAAGAEKIKVCLACHGAGPDAAEKVGPILNGVVGRAAAGDTGFIGYSAAMRAAAANGLVWTPDKLMLYLEKPRDFVPGTDMTFFGLKPDDASNVIAYLETISPDYSPNPPPPAPPAN